MWAWLEQLKAQVIDGRRHPRQPAETQSAVLIDGEREHRVRVIDVSDAGAMVEAGVGLDEGTKVTLQLLDREPLEGQVRWSRDGRIGLDFSQTAPSPREFRDE